MVTNGQRRTLAPRRSSNALKTSSSRISGTAIVFPCRVQSIIGVGQYHLVQALGAPKRLGFFCTGLRKAVHPSAAFRCMRWQTGPRLRKTTPKKRWHADCFTSPARVFRAWERKLVVTHVVLRGLIATVIAGLSFAMNAAAAGKGPEKEQLKLGFIKLTDMAPLAIAYEKGFFEDEGLYVTLEPQANWKVILDRVITGELDGAHMLAGQPLGATIGFGTKAEIVTAYSMDLNGNAITLSNDVWSMIKTGNPSHPIKADVLKPVIEKFRADGKSFRM